MFPFTIRYATDTAIKAGEEERTVVLRDIEAFIEQKNTRKIEINGDRLSFKPGSGMFNWNIMATIEKGIFQVKDKDGYLSVTYEFFMYQLFIFTGVMSIIFGLVSQKWYVGVFIFCWIGGMNWIIAVIRHKAMFDEIISYIYSVDQSDSDSLQSG